MEDERKETARGKDGSWMMVDGGGTRTGVRSLSCISIFIVAMVQEERKGCECTLEGLEAFLLES